MLAISEDLGASYEDGNVEMTEKENVTPIAPTHGNLLARKLTREDDDDDKGVSGDEMNKKYRQDTNNSMDDASEKLLRKVGGWC